MTTYTDSGRRLCRASILALFFLTLVGRAIAAQGSQDQTITGNLTVNGTSDFKGNTLTFGTQSTSPGLSVTYANADTNTLTFFLNRNPGSFLWAHSAAINAMQLTANHELVLWKPDGSIAAITLTPATATISFTTTGSTGGTTTLYRDGANNALRTNGSLTVDNYLTATAVYSSNIIGGPAGAIGIIATGTNQNIMLSPSGTGFIQLGGNVGIGNIPRAKLHVWSTSQATGLRVASDPEFPTILTSPTGVTLWDPNGSPNSAILGFGDGTGWKFHIAKNSDAGATKFVTFVDTGRVGIGTQSPASMLSILSATGDVNGVQIERTGWTSKFRLGAIGSSGDQFWLTNNYKAATNSVDSSADSGSSFTLMGPSYVSFGTASPGVTPAERMRIDSAGKVGIGTTNPESKLEIFNTSAEYLKLGGVPWGMRLGALQTGTQFISLGVKKTAADNAYVAGTGDNAAVNHLVFEMDYSNSGGGFNFLGKTHAADGTALSLTNLMHIDVGGNVGIGTMTPNAGLMVYGAGQTTSAMTTDSGNLGAAIVVNDSSAQPGSGGALIFGANNGTPRRFAAIKGMFTNGGSNGQGDLAFSVRPAATDATLTEAMRITYDGKVGIGTSTPAVGTKLDVAGNVNVSGNLTIGGTFAAGNYTATGGSVTGSTSSGLTLNAGGTDKNVTIIPGGTQGQVKMDIGGTNLFFDNGGVNGGRILSSNGLELTSSGTNQNITLTPSGTGAVAMNGRIISTGSFTYGLNDGVPWWMTGGGNGPAIMLQKHTAQGGSANRRGSLGWMDNNANKSEMLTWDENGYFVLGPVNQSGGLEVVGNIGLSPGLQMGGGGVTPAMTRTITALAVATGAAEGNHLQISAGAAYNSVNSGPTNGGALTLRGGDGYNANGGGGKVYVYGGAGNNIIGPTYANIALAHDGTIARGNVGVGTATPTERLEVNGKVKATGARFDGPVRIAPQGDLAMGNFTADPN